MKIKHVAILAKSAKNSNFCIAGLAKTGEWIRPISNNADIKEAVPLDAIIYPDETELQIFDVVEIKFSKILADNPIQPENFFYDEMFFWQKLGTVTLEKIIEWRGFDNRKKIFYNFDRTVDADFVKRQTRRESLLLLPVKNFIVKVDMTKDRPRFYADFEYNGRKYFQFSVGDIALRNKFQNHDAGEYFLKKNAVVLFSLTNPYKDNRCYKMVAQVF